MHYKQETEAIRYGKLVAKALSGTLTADERFEFDAWLADSEHRALYESLRQGGSLKDELTRFDRYDEQSAYPKFMERRDSSLAGKRPRLLNWLPYAAAGILIALAGAWIFFDDQIQQKTEIVNPPSADISPGGNKARLTLADGRTIDLSEVYTGIVVSDEDVSYPDGTSLTLSPSETLVLTTPKGGTYQVVLPDGSKVWLNAQSSLKYPSRFDGDERVVELDGEAYFDIEPMHHLEEMVPFKVITAGQTVEVIGTEFNISAYPDETETKTTLVVGAVQVVNRISNITNRLSPGTQSIVRKAATDIQKVETEQYTAWKDGRFYFYRTPFKEMIKQVARWYDVDIVYQGNVPKETFSGKMGRDLSLKAMLDLLDISDASIRLEERKLIVNE